MYGEEELVIVLKGLKINKARVNDNVVNEFLDYGSYDIRNKLLKIMNMIFEVREVPSYFRKTLIKPQYKKGEKSEGRNYKGITLVSVGS